MLSSPLPHSPTCEYDGTTRHDWVQKFSYVSSFGLTVLYWISHCLQRSEYELSDCDSNDWTERAQSVEALRQSTDEKCADCKKSAQTQVRKNVCWGEKV